MDMTETSFSTLEIASLPRRAGRSSIYWPHRKQLSRSLPPEVLDRFKGAGLQGSAAVGAAVLGVLSQYWPESECAVGIETSPGEVRVVKLTANRSAPLNTLLFDVSRALSSSDEPPSASPEGDAAFNPLFAILVCAHCNASDFLDLRQDCTLGIDADLSRLVCSYGSRLFDEEVVDNFLGHVGVLVLALLKKATQPIGNIDLLTPKELAFLEGVERGETTASGTHSLTLQHLFSEQAKRAPQAIAIEALGLTHTYRELEEQSDHIAEGLTARDVRTFDRVAMSIRPGFGQIATLLGILKARAVPVPIDYTFPKVRIDTIVRLADAKVCVTDGSLTQQLDSDIRLLSADSLAYSPPVSAVLPAPRDASLDDLAYVLFTSGSTGTPKGVMISQRTLVNLVRWQEADSKSSGPRTLNRSSLAFDVGFQEIFSSLCFGHTLIIASEEERADISGLARLLQEKRISRTFMPPVSLLQVAEAYSPTATPLDELKEIIVAGEALQITPSVIRMFRTSRARLINQYGPTETHVATSYELEGAAMRWPRSPPIGRPIANARVYVLDTKGRRCPIGVLGEIAIGGLLPGRYVNDDVSGKFVVDPYATVGGANSMLYRTGDIGRITPSGVIEFIGRRDDQVKLRGYRVELGDIERNAVTMPGIKLAAAALMARPAVGPFIALFVERRPEHRPTSEKIRRYLLRRLPEHMVPGIRSIIVLDRLPTNSNGKIDRRRLPELLTSDAPSVASFEADELAGLLRAIWQQQLNLPAIGMDDDFLALGGHSLVAIQIVSRVNERHQISLPVATLLRGGTFKWFVDLVDRAIKDRALGKLGREHPHRERSAQKVVLPDGRAVHALYPAEAIHYYREIFERQVYLRHGISLADDATVIDVGANIGLFALSILETCPRSRVVAIEPSPILAELLRANVEGKEKRITVVEAGAYDTTGTRALMFYPGVSGMSSFEPDIQADRSLLEALVSTDRAAGDGDHAVMRQYLDERLRSETLSCRVVRLSELISQLGLQTVDLIKIDVHRGSEQVLAGIDADHWPLIRQVVIEHHSSSVVKSDIERRLSALGFATTTAQDALYRGTGVVYTYGVRTQ